VKHGIFVELCLSVPHGTKAGKLISPNQGHIDQGSKERVHNCCVVSGQSLLELRLPRVALLLVVVYHPHSLPRG
jgi:hypothetical protein